MSQCKRINCEEYKKMLEEGVDHTLIDVRSSEEWQEGHIENSNNIPLPVLELKIKEAIPDLDTKIVACCAGGGRSSHACQTLLGLGYTDVTNLEGGYRAYCQL